MSGVGKTRIMEQTWKEAKEKGVFDNVARVKIGNEKLDVIINKNTGATCFPFRMPSRVYR